MASRTAAVAGVDQEPIGLPGGDDHAADVERVERLDEAAAAHDRLGAEQSPGPGIGLRSGIGARFVVHAHVGRPDQDRLEAGDRQVLIAGPHVEEGPFTTAVGGHIRDDRAAERLDDARCAYAKQHDDDDDLESHECLFLQYGVANRPRIEGDQY